MQEFCDYCQVDVELWDEGDGKFSLEKTKAKIENNSHSHKNFKSRSGMVEFFFFLESRRRT